MMTLRSITMGLSAAVHGGLLFALLPAVADASRFKAYDQGSGNDAFVVEQGIGLDGIVKLGQDIETIKTAEITPVDTAPPVVQEVKAVDELSQAITSSSATAIEENIVKDVEPPKPQQVEEIVPKEQPVQMALNKESSTAKEQLGSHVTELEEYKGKLSKIFKECAFAPKKRVEGQPKVRIIFDDAGNLASREIEKSSGNAAADAAALANVDYAFGDCKDGQLPKPPGELTSDERSLSWNYNFKIKKE